MIILENAISTIYDCNLLAPEPLMQRESNIPTCSQIAAIIVGNIGVKNANHDVIVELKDGTLQRINELHPSYMALQYPFLNRLQECEDKGDFLIYDGDYHYNFFV